MNRPTTEPAYAGKDPHSLRRCSESGPARSWAVPTFSTSKELNRQASTMKAIDQDQYGSPDVLELKEVDKPATRDDDVLARNHAALESRHRVARGCSIAAAVLFGTLASFQVALAAGLPWGEAAWGGGRAELGVELRMASGVQAVLAVGFALVVLRRARHSVWAPLPRQWLPAATWVLMGVMALGTLMNAASRSPIERALWTPIALSLAVLCGIVAAWSPKGTSPTA